MNKKAFSFIEILIVTAIATFLLTSYLNNYKTQSTKIAIKTQSSDIQTIKVSIEAYAAIHGNLPQADTTGDGRGDSDGNGTIPYIDLQLTPHDQYGSLYIYDVAESLVTTTDNNICSELDNVNSTISPVVTNESNGSSYSVAAVIISKGKNKILDGINAVNDRNYSMEINSFNGTSNDDIIVEIKKTVLETKICSEGDNNTSSNIEYGTIVSSVTGRTWLDRNLGASQVCTAIDDENCYGDYYQWGRQTDGHQLSGSTVNDGTLASDINNAGTDFIKSNGDWTSVDSDGSSRVVNWSKIDGTSICPSGYSVPTINELTSENIGGSDDAYDKLKLPTAGFRDNSDGSFSLNGNDTRGVKARIWSSTGDNNPRANAYYYDTSDSSGTIQKERADGYPIRCIKDNPTVSYNGQDYKEVVSSVTGKTWLDRNLGANQVCTSYDDTDCYGDYYQWGRDTDGHEKSNSNTSNRQIDYDATNSSKFIISHSNWSNTTQDDLWNGENSLNNPCPTGYRIPVISEFTAENLTNAFDSFLKFPTSLKIRNYTDGNFDTNLIEKVWASDLNNGYPYYFYAQGGSTTINNTHKANGLSIRCIKD